MKVDLAKIQEYIDQKYISVQKHPTEELYIYNYTQKAQYDQEWNEYTLMCRGLITDAEGNIKARPFKKFFNLAEHKGPLPEGDPVIWEKYDGSLGILYWIGETPHIATRGSFISEQAIRGTGMLHRMKDYWFYLQENETCLFEIIYPENRVVVDYKEIEELVHIATIDIKTGESLSFHRTPFARVLSHKLTMDHLPQRDNAEGYVLEWPNGFRLKVKHDEYVRLHRLVTQVTARSIWDLLRHNEPLDELLERVPDEFYQWVKKTRKNLVNEYMDIEHSTKKMFEKVSKLETRKEQALAMKDFKYKAVVFKILDGKPVDQMIWKLLYPPHITPFKEEI